MINTKKIFSYIKNLGFNLKKSTLMNKYAQSENRYVAFEYFKKQIEKEKEKKNADKIEELIKIILGRLSYSISNSIKDIDEKTYIMDIVKENGKFSLEAIKSYIKKEETIAQAIEVLEHLVGKEELLNYLNSILTTEDTYFDDKLVEKRIEILKHFAGESYIAILDKAIHFLKDSDDRLVISAVRLIRDFNFNGNDEEARNAIIDKIVEEDTSNRLKIELLHVVIKQKWKISGYKKRLEEILPEGYYINAQGYLKIIEKAVTNTDW